MVFGVAAGVVLAFAITIWLARVPSSGPQSKRANAVLRSPPPSSAVPTNAALRSPPPSSVVPTSSAERSP